MPLHKSQVRRFTPDKIAENMGDVIREHFSEFLTPDRYQEWEPRRKVWDLIARDLKMQSDGKVLGCRQAFSSIKFYEDLAVHDDPYFRIVSALINRPLFEDLIELGGLHDVIQGFFLDRYHCMPVLSTRENRYIVCVKIPPFHKRVVIGYPSASRLMKDFLKETSEIWSLDFHTWKSGDYVNFSVDITGCDDGFTEETASPVVQVAKKIIARIDQGMTHQ